MIITRSEHYTCSLFYLLYTPTFTFFFLETSCTPAHLCVYPLSHLQGQGCLTFFLSSFDEPVLSVAFPFTTIVKSDYINFRTLAVTLSHSGYSPLTSIIIFFFLQTSRIISCLWNPPTCPHDTHHHVTVKVTERTHFLSLMFDLNMNLSSRSKWLYTLLCCPMIGRCLEITEVPIKVAS